MTTEPGTPGRDATDTTDKAGTADKAHKGVKRRGRPAAGRRPGRRPGSADTRGEILAAARKTFAEKGFDKATIRGIAREARVDPALVHHYFATKEGLFVAAMRLPMDPSQVVPQILDGPREELGRRVARVLLTLMHNREAVEPVVGLFRAAMTNEQAAATLREFFNQAIVSRLANALDIPYVRMQAAVAQMSGLMMMRYILRIEPLASATIDELVDLVGPTLQRYLVG
ncbi:TetR family transcriptional regulator [Thermopolyspora sp. NPDC052614]|uniref:TetR/AcrR family transcriptional regulator n=1 Tax=Thermopolyspora sp. NPDC052614 TaxID=3155682 RepID=UPI003429E3F4